eukprot:10284490-Ditylum_brightwellii.AAC.1
MPTKKIGSLLVCCASFQHIQTQVQAQTALAVESPTTFVAYIDQQPHHIKCLLGNLHADDVDPEYWIQAISNGKVTIATDGSVAQKKVYLPWFFTWTTSPSVTKDYLMGMTL